MTGAGRTIGRLVALGSVGITGVFLVSAPAAARPADRPPLSIPPVVPPIVPGIPGIQLPPLDLGLAPVTEPLQPPLGTVGSLLVPPAARQPAAPAPAPPAAAPTTPAPVAAPAAPPVPPAPPAVSDVATEEASAPSATPAAAAPAAAAPAAEASAASRSAVEAVTGAARSFTPLFLLAAAVACFLVVQGRLDGREAKLVTAPVAPEVLEFR